MTNWLLLRGLAREQRHWGAFPEALRTTIPGARTHFLDLPGAGTESGRVPGITVREIMHDVRERFGALRAEHPGPWSLFAVSLGAMVAMQWCGDHPRDFERVVLVNTSAGNLSRPWRRMDWRVVPRVLRALASSDAVARERGILAITTRMQPDPEGLAAQWATFQRDRGVKRAAVVRQLVAASRFRAPPALALPALVLASRGDMLTDPDCPARLAAHFGAPLRVHPTAGHDLPLDDPSWVAGEIAAWTGAGGERVHPQG